MSLSYRNQSIDLQSKSIDWFLYKGGIGRYGVKAWVLVYGAPGKFLSDNDGEFVNT